MKPLAKFKLIFDDKVEEGMISEVDIRDFPKTKGDRFNAGKPRMDLIDAQALEGLAQVLTFGAKKYAAHNWRNGLSFSETLGSMLRHIAAIQRGEMVDPESGLPHIDHIGCNWMFLSNFMKNERYTQFNDIWKPDAN